MRFAVTGGAGFIGHHLVKQLKENHTPVVIDTLYRDKFENLLPDIEFHKIDIRDQSLEDVLKDTDGIYHEAALTDVQESFSKQDEYYDVNVKGTENVFKIAKKYGLKVVFASSSSVYGNPKKIPISEDSEQNPINPYGNTKLEDELLASKYVKEGASIIGLRYFNVYGKGQTSSYAGVITKFINRLQEKKPPIIFGDGTQLRDFIFVEDVAQANIVAMQSSVKNGFFNIGTGIVTSIKDLAYILTELAGLEIEPMYEKPLEGDVQVSQADVTLTTRTFNWRHQINLKEGLKKFFPL